MKKVEARLNERHFCEERLHECPHLSSFTLHPSPFTYHPSPLSLPRSGFTLLEVLVASVLMGMLVTILTMIFNQSAIAWRTGKAGIADMTVAERQLVRFHALADNVLPIANRCYCITSPWNDALSDSSDAYNTRGVKEAGSLNLALPTINPVRSDDWFQTLEDASDISGGKAYIVGVRSAGPDRKMETDEDNISTWPEKD